MQVLFYLGNMFAKKVISFKSSRFIGAPAVEYPARSPDLFAVADIYINAALKDFVYHGGPKPTNMAELRAKVLQAPAHVSSEAIRKTFLQMPKRCQACLNANGGLFDENNL